MAGGFGEGHERRRDFRLVPRLCVDGSERLGLRNVTYFVAQSPTPSDHCGRFASAVADDYATLASWRRATALPGPVFHRQDRVSFA